MVERAAVVAEARSWIGVRWAHQGRTRDGVDCAGLIIAVARALRLVPIDFDLTGYSRRPDGTLLHLCDEHMQCIGRDEMQPGDVIVVAFERDPQHIGILGDYPHGGLSIIHALDRPGGHGRVVEHRLVLGQGMRYVASYALPGVA